MDRKIFFDRIRASLFNGKLSLPNVKGMEALLDAGRALPLPHLAHVMAEVYHETARTMEPIKETVMPHHKDRNPSDAEVIRRLDRAWAQGQLPWVKAPYWRAGWFGRGMIQLTHRENYAKFGLAGNPDRALEYDVSARVAVDGCAKGKFRGARLSDYDSASGYKHAAARGIVNGDVPKVGPEIARYAGHFEAALKAAGYRPAPSVGAGAAIAAGGAALATGAGAATAQGWWCQIEIIARLFAQSCGG